jgi:hypothetical protein
MTGFTEIGFPAGFAAASATATNGAFGPLTTPVCTLAHSISILFVFDDDIYERAASIIWAIA